MTIGMNFTDIKRTLLCGWSLLILIGATVHAGWGLGLAIVGDLVAGCDGRLFVKSAPGKGTAVTIRLPSAGMDGETERIDLRCLGNQSHEIARVA